MLFQELPHALRNEVAWQACKAVFRWAAEAVCEFVGELHTASQGAGRVGSARQARQLGPRAGHRSSFPDQFARARAQTSPHHNNPASAHLLLSTTAGRCRCCTRWTIPRSTCWPPK